jgi:hypothetical protein
MLFNRELWTVTCNNNNDDERCLVVPGPKQIIVAERKWRTAMVDFLSSSSVTSIVCLF